jgi:fermentation-respiration switch protein FrsA (DUF1100 family)
MRVYEEQGDRAGGSLGIRRKANGDAERRNVEFAVEGGVTLRGWLFVPGAKGPAPAITMAHGYAGVKEQGIERLKSRTTLVRFRLGPRE